MPAMIEDCVYEGMWSDRRESSMGIGSKCLHGGLSQSRHLQLYKSMVQKIGAAYFFVESRVGAS